MFGTTSMITDSHLVPFGAIGITTKPITGNQIAGPFNSQIGNVTAFAVDKCNLTFVATQSPLNVQGKVTMALY